MDLIRQKLTKITETDSKINRKRTKKMTNRNGQKLKQTDSGEGDLFQEKKKEKHSMDIVTYGLNQPRRHFGKSENFKIIRK